MDTRALAAPGSPALADGALDLCKYERRAAGGDPRGALATHETDSLTASLLLLPFLPVPPAHPQNPAAGRHLLTVPPVRIAAITAGAYD
jgi:hypothetical protein